MIIGCGCRGGELARALVSRGHAVRGTTRNAAHAGAIEAVGAEAVIADPDRVSTLMPAVDRVALVCILLGSARGEPDALSALHGSRLEMLIARLIDTTVRGVVYEARGSVAADVLEAGVRRVRRACERSRVPLSVLDAPPEDHHAWVASAVGAAEGLLGGLRYPDGVNAP